MSDIEIPGEMAELQRRATAALAAVGAYDREVGKPAAEWTDEESARLAELWAEATEAAGALRAAIDASGMELGNGFEFQRALKQAAREGWGMSARIAEGAS
jgi:hypothetical protein